MDNNAFRIGLLVYLLKLNNNSFKINNKNNNIKHVNETRQLYACQSRK